MTAIPPKVSVVVPTFQRASALRRTLTALCALDYPSDALEIVVVDDGSTDSTAQTVADFRRVKYVRQPNRGVAAARNHGARLTTGEILIFVDDDIVVGVDNVQRHLAVRELYDECIVAGHSEFDPDLRERLTHSSFGRFRLWSEDLFRNEEAEHWSRQARIEVPTVDTQNMSISRNLFWEIDGFDEKFPVGAEDQDLCWRARACGAAIVRDRGIRVVHNDQHFDLCALCHREERGAIGIVYMSRKHVDFPAPPALHLNGPLRRDDPPRLAVRKIVRGLMTRPGALALAHRGVRVAERLRPSGGWPVEYLYRAVTGLYVFRGVRRGLQLTAGQTWAPGHESGANNPGVRGTKTPAPRVSPPA